MTRPPHRRTLVALYAVIVLLHLVGGSVVLQAAQQHPALAGMGLAAWLLGLRHAFDADHIAAIDDTVRYQLQAGRTPLAVGFFFSLGHASVVFLLTAAIAAAASAVTGILPRLRDVGALVGAGVSGSFLCFVGILNLLLLLDLAGAWRGARAGHHDHAHLDALLGARGFASRLFGGRLQRAIRHSWQMFPLGMLFGLGLDTASEVGLLAMAAAASAADLAWWQTLALPILFAAGMAAVDTTDGVLMVAAWRWAFVSPLRRITYNLFTTAVSVIAALAVGAIELAQLANALLGLHGGWSDAVARVDVASWGYALVAVLVLSWTVSLAWWKFSRAPARGSARP